MRSSEMPDGETTRSWLPLAILIVLAGAATYLLGLLLWPLFPAIVTSGVVATLLYPAHQRIRKTVRQPDVAALLTTALVFVLVLIPAFALSVALIAEIRAGIDWLGALAEGAAAPAGPLARWWESVSVYLGLEDAGVGDSLAQQMRGFVGLLARRTLRFLSGLGGWLLQLGAAIFTLFYLLRDGEALLRILKWLVPLEPELTDRLISEARDVIFATVYGSLVVAMVQGALGGVAFWVVGLPAAALWGSVMATLSLLPVVGAGLVWAPAGIILITTGDLIGGIGLLIFGAAVISTIDNYLRALLVGGRTQLHPLVVFFSVLGGLLIFGAVGLFVGPVLFVIALSLIEIARTTLDAQAGTPARAAGIGSSEVGHPLTGGFFRRSETTE